MLFVRYDIVEASMNPVLFIFQIVVLVFSVIIHEISHGFVAEKFGDSTARRMGRLTLNPLKHIDPFGSIILPLLMALVPGGVVFGWAKPVPVNTTSLKNPERDMAYIAAAGPLSNLTLALVFAILYRVLSFFFLPTPYTMALGDFFSLISITNISLAIFNLVPIPPLDGSNVLFALLPRSAHAVRAFLTQYGFFLLLAFIFFGIEFISPIIFFVYKLFFGL